MKEFGQTAKSLARNPLGIIALFIVLVYGIAGLVTANSDLTASQRWPLIRFFIGFPILVLIVFVYLVIKHTDKLYGPGDFKDEEIYLKLRELAIEANLGAANVKRETEALQDVLVENKLYGPGDFQNEENYLKLRKSVIEANLVAANAAQQKTSEISNENITKIVTEISPSRSKAHKKHEILWVDDHPENNIYERRALELFDVVFTEARTTQEALAKMRHKKFAAIISDMGRQENEENVADAGIKLLRSIQEKRYKTPYFIYASHSQVHQRGEEALSAGAQGCTASPNELHQMITTTLLQQAC